jgi:hypothetical protein
VKRSRGAAHIRELADIVVDNNGPRLALYHALDRIAADERWPAVAPQRVAVPDLGLPAHLAAYLDALLARVADPAEPAVSSSASPSCRRLGARRGRLPDACCVPSR